MLPSQISPSQPYSSFYIITEMMNPTKTHRTLSEVNNSDLPAGIVTLTSLVPSTTPNPPHEMHCSYPKLPSISSFTKKTEIKNGKRSNGKP